MQSTGESNKQYNGNKEDRNTYVFWTKTLSSGQSSSNKFCLICCNINSKRKGQQSEIWKDNFSNNESITEFYTTYI
jgi:hypothetical protein